MKLKLTLGDAKSKKNYIPEKSMAEAQLFGHLDENTALSRATRRARVEHEHLPLSWGPMVPPRADAWWTKKELSASR